MDAALAHMDAGLALRRENLRLVARPPATPGALFEARRTLSSTLINFAVSICQSSSDGNGGERIADVRRALGEARSLAHLIDDNHNEQAALTCLVNLSSAGGMDDGDESEEGEEQGAALKRLLARS